jgi:hypothetical protein
MGEITRITLAFSQDVAAAVPDEVLQEVVGLAAPIDWSEGDASRHAEGIVERVRRDGGKIRVTIAVEDAPGFLQSFFGLTAMER